jgi:hypothetical protein
MDREFARWDEERIAAVIDLWFGGTGIPLPDEACQGHRAAGTKTRHSRRRHTVVVSANIGVSAIAGGRD